MAQEKTNRQKTQLENKNCKPHTYKIRDKLLVHNKKTKQTWGALCRPLSNNPGIENVNVTINRGSVQEHINIIWVKNYHE